MILLEKYENGGSMRGVEEVDDKIRGFLRSSQVFVWGGDIDLFP